MHVERKPFSALTDEERSLWTRYQRANPALAGPYFTLAYNEAVARVRRRAEILIARENGRPAAFFAIEPGGLSVRPLGGTISDLHAVIAPPGSHIDLGAMLRAAGLSLATLTGAPSAAPGHFPGAERERFWQMDLSRGFEAWRAAVRKEARSMKRLGAKRRKLESAFGNLCFTLDDRCEAAFDQLWAWKSRQYRESGHPDLARALWFRELMEDFFARAPGSDVRGVLSTLTCDGRPVAAHFGHVADGVLHYWFPAYDPLAHRFSPGLLLLEDIAAEHETLGIRRIDLGPGEYRYKREFSNASIDIRSGLAGAGPAYRAARALVDLDERLSALPIAGLQTWPRRAVRKLDRMIAA